MKNNLSKILGLFALGGLAFFQSCTSDDGTGIGGGGSDSPSISLDSGTGFITSDATVAPGDTVYFKVSAAKGEENLKTFTIKRNGSNESKDNLIFDGAAAAANPKLIAADAEKSSFTTEVGVIVPNENGQSYTYLFEVADDANLSSSRSVVLTTEAVADTLSLTFRTPSSSSVIIDSDQFLFDFTAEASAGLKSLTIYLDGAILSPDSILSVARDSLYAANPLTLSGNTFGDTVEISLGRALSEVMFKITDNRDSTYSKTFTIDTRLPNDLEEFTGIKVYNAVGSGLGGLDLDASGGVSAVSSLGSEFEIKDAGIDGGVTSPNENWKAKIVPAAGVTIKPVPASFELSYDNAVTHASLVTAYGNLTGEVTSTGETAVVQQDDAFIVKKGDNYFIIKVTAVSEASGTNDDFFEISAKRKSS